MQASKVNTSWMLPDEQCWVEQDPKSNSPNVFKRAQIKSLEGNQANVIFLDEQGKPLGSESKVNVATLLECNKESKPEGWDDMVQMNVLNDAEILNNVNKRFSQDWIFSYIGPTLIVMNPYKLIQKSFNSETMSLFQKAVRKGDGFQQSEYPPHVYALSANAYVQLFTNNKNQAIVISGESGAGKTENAKFSMKYLTSLSDIAHHHDDGYSSVATRNKMQSITNKQQQVPIEEKILGCNPILESFGNAKTVRNNNSSRFGKYVRIWIERKKKHIKGACISNYLLEKSRVTIVADGERNYHIFYSFLAGVSQQILQEFNMKRDPTLFNYLKQSSSLQVEGIDDIENFNEVQQSFHKLNFTPQEEKSIYSLLASILYLGNVEFDDKTYSDGNTPCSVANMDVISRIAAIMQIDQTELMNSLVYKRRVIAGKAIDSSINKQDCTITRDSLARALYDKLFIWLVSKLNQNIMPEKTVNMNDCLSLGLLDIFGFENFKVNSFEQLCINFTNEKLQQLYIVYVFKSEEEEFKAEGLNDYMKSIDFKDNQGIIDLISKPPTSIYDLLDDQCTINTGTDEALLKKIITQHAQSEYLVNAKPHLVKDSFTIRHTAKDVEYNIQGFRIKNKDEISDSINDVISKSLNNEVKAVWTYDDQQNSSSQQNQKSISAKSKSNKFLGAKFRNQIKELMDELCSCDVHFIRCIKPNEQKQKNMFDETFVMLQIRYLGILESVRVRKEGFPSRFVYDLFYQRYYELYDQLKKTNPTKFSSLSSPQKKDLCTQLIQHLISKSKLNLAINNNVLFGYTKIYMKLAISNLLDSSLLDLFKLKEKMAIRISKNIKVYLYKKNIFLKIKQLKEKFARFIILQRKYKSYLIKKREKRLKQIKEGFSKITSLLDMRLYQTFETFKQAMLKDKQFNFFKVLQNAFNRVQKEQKQHVLTLFKLKFSPQQKANIIGDQLQQINQLTDNAGSSQGATNQNDRSRQQNLFVENPNSASIQNQRSQEELSSVSTQMSNVSSSNNVSTPQQNGQNQDDYFHNILNPDNQDEEKKQEKTVKDEFSTDGLDVWPSMTEKEDEEERKFVLDNKKDNLIVFLRDHIAQEFQTMNPKQSQIDLEKAQTLPLDQDFNISLNDIDAQLMKKVEETDFFQYCNNYIVKSKKNFGKNIPPIHTIMSYSSSNLVDPLTQSPTIQNHSQLIFRSLLKLAKNRRSRFPPQTHIENIILMCYGTPEKMSESIFSSVRDENTKILQNYSSSKFQTNNNGQGHQSVSNASSHSSTINQSAIQPNEDDEPNIKEILGNKIMQIVNNSHQAIRDETFMQLCKQIHNQPILDSQRILLQFFTEMIGLFPPSDFLLIPLMNYFKYIANRSTDDKVQKECKFIFIKLAKIWQSYNMIKIIDFTQYTHPFLIEYSIYKDIDRDEWMKDVLSNKISQFDFFYNHVQRVDSREQLPTEWERAITNEHKLFRVKIYLLNEMSITVTIQPSYSIKQVRDIVLNEIGLSHRSQYFGLVQSKLSEGKHYEHFLKNNQKMLDAVNTVINDTKYLEGYKKTVITKFYLRIKICYKLYKDDIDSTTMYFFQSAFDVRYNKHNLKPQEAYTLAAYHLFIENGPFEPSQESFYRKKCIDYLPTLMVNPKTLNELYHKIFPIYRSLEFESQSIGRWKYLEYLRSKDTFMTYQLEAHQFCIRQKGDKYQKDKEGRLVLLGIRPYQIVILDINDKSTQEVIELEEIETWGLNQSQRAKNNTSQQFFFLKVKQSDILYVFHILFLQVANLLIHSYALKKSIGDEDNEYKDCFLDILSILFDKEEQVPE